MPHPSMRTVSYYAVYADSPSLEYSLFFAQKYEYFHIIDKKLKKNVSFWDSINRVTHILIEFDGFWILGVWELMWDTDCNRQKQKKGS